MIRFVREGHRVFCKAWNFHFSFDATYEWAAILLVEKIRNEFRCVLEEIRRKAYEQGWNDAKTKQKKETRFDGDL